MASRAEPRHPLEAEFGKFLPLDLAAALCRQYVRVKQRARASDDEGVQESGGKVAEHALRSAQSLAGQPVIGLREEIRDVPAHLKQLENLPRSLVRDSLRIVVPRVIGTLYTVRNKRSGGHTASEVDPSHVDATLTENLADWLMAEIFRIGTDLPLQEAEAAISTLMERRIPIVFRAGQYRRVLKQLDPQAEIMVLLYAEAAGATMSELHDWTGIPRTTLGRQLDALERARLLRTVSNGRTKRIFLLPTGEKRVEDEGWLDPD